MNNKRGQVRGWSFDILGGCVERGGGGGYPLLGKSNQVLKIKKKYSGPENCEFLVLPEKWIFGFAREEKDLVLLEEKKCSDQVQKRYPPAYIIVRA